MVSLESKILNEGSASSGPGSGSGSESTSTPHPEDLAARQLRRSISPTNTDDELGSDISRPASPLHPARTAEDVALSEATQPGSGSGSKNSKGGKSNQTGVKGVIRDAGIKKEISNQMNKLKIRETNKYLESKSFQAMTVHEEEEMKKREIGIQNRIKNPIAKKSTSAEDEDEDEELERIRRKRLADLTARHKSNGHIGNQQQGDDGDGDNQYLGGIEEIRKPGLREVGAQGFLNALDRTSGWVVLLLIEPVSCKRSNEKSK